MAVIHAAHKNRKVGPGVVERFRLSNGQLVIVKGFTQRELNSLHEALQKMLSAGATITGVTQSGGQVQIRGTFNGNKGGLVGLFQKDFTAGLADLGFIKNKYSFTWNPRKSRVTKVQTRPGGTSGNPIGDPLGGLAGDIGKGLTTGIDAAVKDTFSGVSNSIKGHPAIWVIIGIALIVLIGAATHLASGSEPA